MSLAIIMATAVIAACGGTSDDEFNDADVAFAQDMIPHHTQAVEISQLADGRTSNVDVLALAQQISAEQQPEIDTMTGFLEAWGQPAESSADMGGMEGMDLGDGGMVGMASDDDMIALEAATDSDFDTQFLTMMIAHHEGATQMAQVELDEGVNPEAQELATDIIAAQEAELATMQQLLTTTG